MKKWAIVLAVAAIGYYFWKKERNARGAADAAAAGAQRAAAEDPLAAVKASTDSMLEKANQLIGAVRNNPAVGAALGLAPDSISRIIYDKDAYAAVSGQAFTENQKNFFNWHTDPYAK